MQIVCLTFIISGFPTASKFKLPKFSYHMICKAGFRNELWIEKTPETSTFSEIL